MTVESPFPFSFCTGVPIQLLWWTVLCTRRRRHASALLCPLTRYIFLFSSCSIAHVYRIVQIFDARDKDELSYDWLSNKLKFFK
jgi:hypothetical protein